MALEKEWLRKLWVDQGATRQEIVDLYYQETGNKITGSAVSMAIKRYDLPGRQHRWDDLLPWKVSVKHTHAKEARLLRLAGRRMHGLENPPQFEQWLDGWLQELNEAGRPVVAYYPDTVDGFHYHPRVPEDGDGEWDLIRRPEVQEELDRRAS